MPSISTLPTLPAPLRLPFRLLPAALTGRAFCATLNHLLKDERQEDELAFLENRTVAIVVTDAKLRLLFTLRHKQLVSCSPQATADLTLQGSMYDFLLMLSRKEDPDTLFFNRRLKLSGDTELGLYVKNFLDALDMTDQWKHIHWLSDRARQVAERIG